MLVLHTSRTNVNIKKYNLSYLPLLNVASLVVLVEAPSYQV
jgi:hypothetical protein